MYVTAFLSVTSVLLIVYLKVYKKWHFLKRWNIPHDPPSIFTLGNSKRMYGTDPFRYELECKKKYGNVWGFYVTTQPRIVVHDVEILRQILVKNFSTFRNRTQKKSEISSNSLENGILVAQDAHWKRMRSTLSPAFTSAKLKQMFPILEWCINNALDAFEWKIEHNAGIFDAKETFHRLSLDVICSSVFSIDVDSQNDAKPEPEISKQARAYFKSNKTLVILMYFLLLTFPRLMKLLPINFIRGKHVEYMDNVCKELIKKRKKQDQNNGNKRNDIMDMMLDARISDAELANGATKGLSEAEIFGNAVTMLLAGYDTTGVSMTYLAYNLAMHQDIQSRLQNEIDQAFGDRSECDSDIDIACNIKYLDMCINENLRLYCPLARAMRPAPKNVTINGLTIPEGAVVIVPIYALCHDPEHWSDPMDFNPERMRNMDGIDPMVFQPFGMGPRNCIGQKFALVEMKLAFCALLRRYSFRPSNNTPQPPLEITQLQTTTPIEKFNLQVERRR